MIDNRPLLFAAALACLAMAGCGDKKAAEGNKAAGEVLEGTISDAMIARDAVRSDPPLAPRKTDAPDAKGGKAQAKPADGTEPAETPTPEAGPTADSSPAPKPKASEPAG